MNPTPNVKQVTATTVLIALGIFILLLPIHWRGLLSGDFLNMFYHLTWFDLLFTLLKTIAFVLIYFMRHKKAINSFVNIIHQKNKDLKQKNDELELLIESSSAVVWRVRVDADFTMLYSSENVKQMLGYSVEEMFIKHFWADNLHPDDKHRVFGEIPAVFEKGHLKFQYRFRHKDGSWPWMQAELKCIYDDHGKPIELVGNWWDITKQKQIQETIDQSNERFELASRATHDVIYDWDLVTHKLWMSDEMFCPFGYPKTSNNLELSWRETKIHAEDRDRLQASIISAIDKKEDSWQGTYRFEKADGTYADIYDRGFIVYNNDGHPLRWIGSMSDISEQKKIEQELRFAKEKAEESAKAKSEFLANMSHEIRTPLNGIVGMTELALDTPLTDEQRHYLKTVKLSCDSLMELINDILDFSKIDAGKMDLAVVEFSLREAMPSILQPLGLKASLKKLEFVFSIENDLPDLLIGDLYRLQQIVTNLAGNAIKFTEKGEVVLHAQLQSVEGDQAMLLFSVTDTGIGIPSNKLATVFEEFRQADGSTTRKYGGTGLGLAITKRLVELMGGTLWVESREGIGSVFYFSLRMKLQPQAKHQTIRQLPVLEEVPVLVVEDNASTRNYLVEVLRNFRMKPLAVATGEEAVKALDKAAWLGQAYPVMLLDISLGGKMDGFDVATHVRSSAALAKTGIVVISMSQSPSARERFSQLGVDHFFSKPFSQSDILDSLQNLLSGKETHTHRGQRETTSHTPATKGRAYNILLVEDNLVNQEVATMMLEKKGHTVQIASNGEEAVALYKKENYDLLLMDVQMPVLNGYEATRQIRELEQRSGRRRPIIGLTANAMKGDREKCLEAGMDDYLSKPVRVAELAAALDRLQPNAVTAVAEDVQPVNTLVNLEPLLKNLDGRTEILQKLLAKFEPTVLANMEALELEMNNANTTNMILHAHSIKGQCMHVEMKAVIEQAAKIEILAIENELAKIIPLMPSLKVALKEGLEALKVAVAGVANK